MSVPFQAPAFTLGEVSPSLFGRQDLARSKVAASTVRNMWPRYSGGLYSRAGTAFVGYSKQTGRSFPPRLIPFQFAIDEALILEFGHKYMRCISGGAYVTETPMPIQAITQAFPTVVTAAAQGAVSAVPINTAVTVSYSPHEIVTLAGGVYGGPAQLQVTNTVLFAVSSVQQAGINYVPGDTIVPNGGTSTTPSLLTVTQTQVLSAAVVGPGAGGTDGIQVVTGTTGVGTPFQARVVVSGGAIIAVLNIVDGGAYTSNPLNLAAEPVIGGGLVGATLFLVMGVKVAVVTSGGVYTANPNGSLVTQLQTSGTGTGAAFLVLMAPNIVTVFEPGTYTTLPTNPVSQASTNAEGAGATFTVTWGPSPKFNIGDWVYVRDVVGMTELNNRFLVIYDVIGNDYTLQDIFGNLIDSAGYAAYVSGGTLSRVYTLPTPYDERDIEYLKFVQSADVMSLCCVNQESFRSYQPQDLTRTTDTHWAFEPTVATETVLPPPATTISITNTTGDAWYAYKITSINPADGTESLPTPEVAIGGVDIFTTEGTVTVGWTAVSGVVDYNVYRAPITFFNPPAVGVPYGLIATVHGLTFQDSGTIPVDYAIQPPVFNNPFVGARNYPGVVSYFQERRVYANSLNQPDTYWMSQTGSFTNFDVRSPPVDSDAITGSPWSVQVDGVQALVDMPGGLVTLTGREAWQLTGPGGSSLNPQPITPAGQQAQPQAFNGCHSHVPPIRIDYDILYVQAKGFKVRDLAYQIGLNIYTGIDMTLSSSHLFDLYQIQEWAWTEEPHKILWVVRTDGVMLSMTYVKPENILGWARHDTDGSFVSCASITEPPVDALYVATKRDIGTHTAIPDPNGNNIYFVERMDDRIWDDIDSAWCVDCALTLPQPQPEAILQISPWSYGLGRLAGATTVDPGNSNYSRYTTGIVTDDNGTGPGFGGVVEVDVVNGVPYVVFPNPGQDYINPLVTLYDPFGSEGGTGAVIRVNLETTVVFTTDTPVFFGNVLGNVIRVAGGQATITGVISTRQVLARVTVPFRNVIPLTSQDISQTPPSGFSPVSSGNWTMTTPVMTVTGLWHFVGEMVTGVADGHVITPRIVSDLGTITLDTPATNVIVGLAFTAQFQSLYLDPSQYVTVQGQRKKNAAVTVRMEASRGFEVGANQVDGSTLSPMQIAPRWHSMVAAPDLGQAAYNSTQVPLATGDLRVPLPGGFNTRGQVAIQQRLPLPLNILSIITEDLPGDLPQLRAPQKSSRGDMVPAQ